MAADLILEGFRLEEVSRDDSPYTGSDGEVIHAGNHLHDPCTGYVGERFTLGGGFVVVNDCQVVECTKWKTDEDDSTGGQTVIHDLVEDSDSSEKWSVQESGTCAYVGKFFLKEDDCEIEGTPGSIACLDEPMMTVSSIVMDPIDKAGISLGALLGAAALALLVLYCMCCRRKKQQNKDTSSDSGSTVDEERGLAKIPPPTKGDHVVAATAAGAAGGGWFGARKSAKSKSKSDVKKSKKSSKADMEQPKGSVVVPVVAEEQAQTKKSWSFRKKEEQDNVAAKVPSEKKGWFGKKKTEEVEAPVVTEEKKGLRSLFSKKKRDQSETEITLEPEEPKATQSQPSQPKSTEKTEVKSDSKKVEEQQEKQAKATEDAKKSSSQKKETVASTDVTEPVDCTCCGLKP